LAYADVATIGPNASQPSRAASPAAQQDPDQVVDGRRNDVLEAAGLAFIAAQGSASAEISAGANQSAIISGTARSAITSSTTSAAVPMVVRAAAERGGSPLSSRPAPRILRPIIVPAQTIDASQPAKLSSARITSGAVCC
jgi:hypothetical protein